MAVMAIFSVVSRHFARSPAVASSRTRCSQPRFGAFPIEFGLKLCQRSKDTKHQPSIGGRGINLRTCACQDFQADLPLIQADG